MNPIQNAINSLMMGGIPRQILEYCFAPTRSRFKGRVNSIEQEIRSKVIDARVMADVNLNGGTMMWVPINPSASEAIDLNTWVCKIDSVLLQNRSITEVYEVTWGGGGGAGYNGMSGYAPYTGHSLNRSLNSLVNAAANNGGMSTSDVTLIGYNTIRVGLNQVAGRGMMLRCRVSDDDQLSSLRPGIMPYFNKLVLYATRSYLYNNFVIEVDENLLQGGQTLGSFRDILSNYADAEEMYQDALVKWRKVSVTNDPLARRMRRNAMIRK